MNDDTQAVETTTTEAEPVEQAPAAPEKPLSAGDALRAAAKKLEPAPKPAPKVTEKAPAKPAEPAKQVGPARDAAGRFASPQGEPAKPDAAPEQAAEPAPAEAQAEAAPDKPAEQPKADARAPQSWSPAVREEWNKLPPAVREQVIKRERDFAVGIQQHAERAKYGDQVRQAISPYEQHWRAKGIDPTQAIQGLARVDYMLTTGSPQERARLIGHLVRTSLGTDEAAIQLLGAAIDGGGAQTPQQVDPAAIAQQVEARIMRQLEQSRAQAAQARAQESLARLSEREFFADVQQDMADLLELATKRGQAMTPEQAYDRAVAMNPELSRIVQQREAAKKAEESRAAQARTGAAAGSLRSQPGAAPGVSGKNLTASQALRQAAADLSGRGRV